LGITDAGFTVRLYFAINLRFLESIHKMESRDFPASIFLDIYCYEILGLSIVPGESSISDISSLKVSFAK